MVAGQINERLMDQYDSTCPLLCCDVSVWPPSRFKKAQVLRLNSSLETPLYSTFPPLSHAYPGTSPGTTNTDVLFSILLHCLSAQPYFTPNGEDSRSQGSVSLAVNAGWVQDGALRGGQEERCGYSAFPFQPENIPQTSLQLLSRTKLL